MTISEAEIRTLICIFISLLCSYSLIELSEEYGHVDTNLMRQPVYVPTTDYTLPNHGYDKTPHAEKTVESAIAVGTVRGNLNWLQINDYQPRQAFNLNYLYQSIGTVFPS